MNQKIISILLKKARVRNNDLVRLSGIPKADLRRELEEISQYLMPVSQFVEIKPEFREELVSFAGETDWGEITKRIVKELLKYKNQRPPEDRLLDQFTATNWTSARRAILMAKNGDINNKNVAIIGDDDMNSLAVSLVGGAVRIMVFEIDQRIIEITKQFNVEVVKYDVRNVLPTEYIGMFDTVLMDPPYTLGAMSQYLNRAIELLKPNMTSRIYAAYGNSDRARERELEIQKMMVEKGLLIKEKKYQFCRYHGAESIGSRSSLYLLDWTPKTKNTTVNDKKFYTYE